MSREGGVEYDKGEYPNGLNDKFLTMDKDALSEMFGNGKGIFENPELRDIAKNKEKILQVLKERGLQSGKVFCDIGAGSGLFVEDVCNIVGPSSGTYFACEISPGFVELLSTKYTALVQAKTLQVVLSTDDTLNVPSESVDMAFICDVYHHLEYPVTFMRDVRRSLKADGKLVVIDFHRDSSKIWSKEAGWAERHVRADQGVFRDEILSAGFSLLEEPVIESMQENYIMIFTKSIHDTPQVISRNEPL